MHPKKAATKKKKPEVTVQSDREVSVPYMGKYDRIDTGGCFRKQPINVRTKYEGEKE